MRHDVVHSASHRRGFLVRLSAAFASFAATGAAPVLAAPAPSAGRSRRPEPRLDDGWLDALTGEHRQIFDVTTAGSGILRYVRNYLNAYRDAYGARPGEVNAVLGLHGKAVVMGLGDALWEKYGLGKRMDIEDPATRRPAVRNPWLRVDEANGIPEELTIPSLQARGAVLIACNNVLRFLSEGIAKETGGSAAEVRDELEAGALPGVTVVPAMIAAFQRAQARGCSYVYAG